MPSISVGIYIYLLAGYSELFHLAILVQRYEVLELFMCIYFYFFSLGTNLIVYLHTYFDY